MKYKFPALIIKEEDGFVVEFPDLEGCQTYGSTLEETMELAQEALGLYLASLMERNLPVPDPSDIASFDKAKGQSTYITTKRYK